ncbi:MAG: hypothetical protein ABR587_15360 [Candidatus Binatia bacterium]
MIRTRLVGCLSALGIVAIVVALNAPLLDGFDGLLRQRHFAATSSDGPTHYFRMLEARNLYLPSGHRLGWEPYWYQGYVPFLLYPHLTYVLLALVSLAVPIDPGRIFNAYTIILYFALPLTAALAVFRRSGWLAAVVVAAWYSVVTAFGAGAGAVFHVGLLSQQAGLLLFVLLAHDLLVTRRVDRAAIWLGLIPLVHVHASLIAGVVWLGAGLVAAASGRERSASMRAWLAGSVVAALISSPTSIALIQGWDQVGGSTGFGQGADLYSMLMRGKLLAPLPTLAAICVCFAATAVVGVRVEGERARFAVWTAIAVVFFAGAFGRAESGLALWDRIQNSMLYLRTFSFAFVWTSILAVSSWKQFPKAVRLIAVLLSLWGVADGWSVLEHTGSRLRSRLREAARSDLLQDYERALEWIENDAAGWTTTLAICKPRTSMAPLLLAAVKVTGLPLLGGHGVELTAARNVEIVNRNHPPSCNKVRQAVDRYVVGYIVGATSDQREHFEDCLDLSTVFVQGDWWIIATGKTWNSHPQGVIGFAHNSTWTELKWSLADKPEELVLRLPMANTAPWSARIDGHDVPIESTDDLMMQVKVPPNAETLELAYLAYGGEWSSTALAGLTLLIASRRARRRRAQLGHKLRLRNLSTHPYLPT